MIVFILPLALCLAALFVGYLLLRVMILKAPMLLVLAAVIAAVVLAGR